MEQVLSLAEEEAEVEYAAFPVVTHVASATAAVAVPAMVEIVMTALEKIRMQALELCHLAVVD